MMVPPFRLLALGSNGSGQLGVSDQFDRAMPTECKFQFEDVRVLERNDGVSKVVTGGNHTLVLLRSGAVFAAGNNDHQRCGLPVDVQETATFRRVVFTDEELGNDVSWFADVAATWESSHFIGKNGRRYVCGTGSKGELGLGVGLAVAESVRKPNDLGVEARKIFGGVSHVIMLTAGGDVHGWGSCRKGELGMDMKDVKIAWTPRNLQLQLECNNAVTGREFTLLLGDGQRRVFGRHEYLQRLNIQADLPFDRITAGWSTVYLLKDGRVQAFGRNDRGQVPPGNLPDLEALAGGSEHCLGLTTTKEVITWGWGEHGNCGQPTDEHGNVADRWNVLPVLVEANEFITGVAAGCATSFVMVEKKD